MTHHDKHGQYEISKCNCSYVQTHLIELECYFLPVQHYMLQWTWSSHDYVTHFKFWGPVIVIFLKLHD